MAVKNRNENQSGPSSYHLDRKVPFRSHFMKVKIMLTDVTALSVGTQKGASKGQPPAPAGLPALLGPSPDGEARPRRSLEEAVQQALCAAAQEVQRRLGEKRKWIRFGRSAICKLSPSGGCQLLPEKSPAFQTAFKKEFSLPKIQ